MISLILNIFYIVLWVVGSVITWYYLYDVFYKEGLEQVKNLTESNEHFHLMFLEEIYKFYDLSIYSEIEESYFLYNVSRLLDAMKNHEKDEFIKLNKNIIALIEKKIQENIFDMHYPAKIAYEILSIIIYEQIIIFNKSSMTNNKNYTYFHHKILLSHSHILFMSNDMRGCYQLHVRKQIVCELQANLQETYNLFRMNYYQDIAEAKLDKLYTIMSPDFIIIYLKQGTILPSNVEMSEYFNGNGIYNSFLDEDKILYSVDSMVFYKPSIDNWAYIRVEDDKFLLKSVKNEIPLEKVFKEWNLCYIICVKIQ